MNCTYDGSFEGLLSLIFQLFELKEYNVNIERRNPNSLFQGTYFETSEDKSERVYKKLSKIITAYEMESIFTAFLSEKVGVENTIFNYIVGVIRGGRSLKRNYNSGIDVINKVSYKVCREACKFKGFVRFRRLVDGTYYAIIKSEGNTLPIIQGHFEERFSDQNFIIHDVNRDKALVYSKEQRMGYITTLKKGNEELLSYAEDSELLHEEEKGYIDMWRGFFDSVSIEGRKNLKCQRNFMPKKYWENMVEVNRKTDSK